MVSALAAGAVVGAIQVHVMISNEVPPSVFIVPSPTTKVVPGENSGKKITMSAKLQSICDPGSQIFLYHYLCLPIS